MAERINGHVDRGASLNLTVDGRTVKAYAGETVATLLFTENVRIFYRTDKGRARAPYCNMGTCFECLVQVKRSGESGFTRLRACMTAVEENMSITTGEQPVNAGEGDVEN